MASMPEQDRALLLIKASHKLPVSIAHRSGAPLANMTEQDRVLTLTKAALKFPVAIGEGYARGK
jgi:hypothetical protein